MNHAGSIDSQKAYTLAELARLLETSSDKRSQRVKIDTVRENLRAIGCPLPKLGRMTLIPGVLIIQALERQTLSEADDDE